MGSDMRLSYNHLGQVATILILGFYLISLHFSVVDTFTQVTTCEYIFHTTDTQSMQTRTFTVLSVCSEAEPGGAGAVVGARGVLTGLGTQAARVPPALVHIWRGGGWRCAHCH